MTAALRSARSLPLWTLIGGLIAAILDIGYAIGYWGLTKGVPAERVLHSVASGLIGREAALAGGAGTAALGLLLHCFIAVLMAAAYAIGASRLAWMRRSPWRAATLYGLWLFVAMNFIVVPLSRAGMKGLPPDPVWIGLSILVHVVFVAWPIAWAVNRALNAKGGRHAR
ncbi:hypothetical protein RDV84_13655 [Lysobacter yananisis]|uniref:DUF1440 domain-containing protein n=1 Tax=Lysobacter yananisis TaxID=1003114 RepID=A0ABY9P2B9_9GAMM|nr:hypothetical protein [Lysobacter yananisis]WMT01054.1 hypothetical protein RDV84_13655 [Lysobacter yananisis]